MNLLPLMFMLGTMELIDTTDKMNASEMPTGFPVDIAVESGGFWIVRRENRRKNCIFILQ